MNKVKIEIGNKERQLLGTFQNIMDIEQELGTSVFKLIAPILSGTGTVDLSFKQMVAIIYFGLRGLPDNTLERESIRNEVMEKGYVVYLNDCLAFLLACVSGGKKKAEEAGSQELSVSQPSS